MPRVLASPFTASESSRMLPGNRRSEARDLAAIAVAGASFSDHHRSRHAAGSHAFQAAGAVDCCLSMVTVLSGWVVTGALPVATTSQLCSPGLQKCAGRPHVLRSADRHPLQPVIAVVRRDRRADAQLIQPAAVVVTIVVGRPWHQKLPSHRLTAPPDSLRSGIRRPVAVTGLPAY